MEIGDALDMCKHKWEVDLYINSDTYLSLKGIKCETCGKYVKNYDIIKYISSLEDALIEAWLASDQPSDYLEGLLCDD